MSEGGATPGSLFFDPPVWGLLFLKGIDYHAYDAKKSLVTALAESRKSHLCLVPIKGVSSMIGICDLK